MKKSNWLIIGCLLSLQNLYGSEPVQDSSSEYEKLQEYLDQMSGKPPLIERLRARVPALRNLSQLLPAPHAKPPAIPPQKTPDTHN